MTEYDNDAAINAAINELLASHGLPPLEYTRADVLECAAIEAATWLRMGAVSRALDCLEAALTRAKGLE